MKNDDQCCPFNDTGSAIFSNGADYIEATCDKTREETVEDCDYELGGIITPDN